MQYHYIQIGDIDYNSKPISMGVPHGSVISLFLTDNRYKLKIIKYIQISISNGHGRISSKLLWSVNEAFFSCIILIINQSLTTGIFPDKLKITEVFEFWHSIKCSLLKYQGVKYLANALRRSYLSNRKQYVQIENINSHMLSINTVVPQG